jgi:hypothetical protein
MGAPMAKRVFSAGFGLSVFNGAWTQRAEILSHASWSRGEPCSKTMSLSTWCHPETPVAIISARDDVDEAASKAGADAAISKQTPLPDTISSLRRLFR